ncbi:MAG: hypothetical protein OXG60_08700 [Chloroflexi bacterium]|nr:hypothetical protein [Chloroflexota bacterium]
MTLLLAPFAVQAQTVGLTASQGAGNSISATVHFGARASTVRFNWGDGSSSSTSPKADSRSARSRHEYEDCGVKSISVSVSFHGGGSGSDSMSITVGCSPTQSTVDDPTWAGAVTCDIEISPGHFACRPVPSYFLENRRALKRAAADKNRRPLSSYGYRCPDAQGNCPTDWILSPGRKEGGHSGLSNPDSFKGSEVVKRAGAGIQRINAAGIGVKWIVDENPIDAVDVWGPGAQDGGEVCFTGTEGRLVYLDARTSPRAQSFLSTTVKGDSICGTMPGPGSVVYLPPEG